MVEMDQLVCQAHGKTLSPDCDHCKSLLLLMGEALLAQHGIVAEGVDVIPDTTFGGGQPSKTPTLHLPKVSQQYGRQVYTAAPLTQAAYTSMVKDNLWISPEVHDLLMGNLGIDEFLQPYLDHPIYSILKE